jgi:hypothetical protein
MVSVEKENAYQLREYLRKKVAESVGNDPLKESFMAFLKLSPTQTIRSDRTGITAYQKCAIDGLGLLDPPVSDSDVHRLLGQAASIENTPMAWVSDLFGVMAVKWLTERRGDAQITREFKIWTENFLPKAIKAGRLSLFERDVASYIIDPGSAVYVSACIPLFLHYQGARRIDDHAVRLKLIENFMSEFRSLSQQDVPTALLGAMIYVFDNVNKDVGLVPPNGWSLGDLIKFLESIPIGLKRWTWETVGRTKGASPVKWLVENEYHVQNLLYALLAPTFNKLCDEVYLEPVGQKTPRVDLYIPELHTLIEVKYRKDSSKSFQSLIGEIGEDASLYRTDPKYKDARIVVFLWDHTRATQEHPKFKEGIGKISGIDGCVVISAPSVMG